MKKRIGKKTELLIVLLISFGVVFGILCGTGTLFSGWHFVDDHEYAEYVYMMKYQHISPWQLMYSWLTMYKHTRFQPLYFPIRILAVCLLGTNLVAFSIVRGILVALTLVFLYYAAKLMGTSSFYASLFASISLVGYQSAMWWKLGTQEALGTCLLAAGFYCMLKWLQNNKTAFAVVSLLIFTVAGNYKESYIVTIPFMLAYVIYDTYRDKNTIREMWDARSLLSKRIWYLVTLSIILIVLVMMVLLLPGTGYFVKGMGLSEKIQAYIGATSREFSADLKWVKWASLFLIAIVLTYLEELKKLWKEVLLTIIYLLPQVALYGETGFLERYILPASIGYAFFFVVVLSRWKVLTGKRRKFYAFVLIMLLLLNTRAMLVEADYFRYRGESITTMMEEVNKMSGKDKKILSCFSPHEESNITLKYWMLLNGNDRIYYWHQGEQKIDHEFNYDKYPDLTGASKDKQKFDDMDIVVMYNRNDRDFNHEVNLDLSDFKKLDCGTITIYVRNNEDIAIPDIHVRPAYYYAK